jgi:hypothetical protein
MQLLCASRRAEVPIVYYNDQISLEQIRAMVEAGTVHSIVISPGPGTPDNASDIGKARSAARPPSPATQAPPPKPGTAQDVARSHSYPASLPWPGSLALPGLVQACPCMRCAAEDSPMMVLLLACLPASVQACAWTCCAAWATCPCWASAWATRHSRRWVRGEGEL